MVWVGINWFLDFRCKHPRNRTPNQMHLLNQNLAHWLNQLVWPKRIHFYSNTDLAVRKLHHERPNEWHTLFPIKRHPVVHRKDAKVKRIKVEKQKVENANDAKKNANTKDNKSLCSQLCFPISILCLLSQPPQQQPLRAHQHRRRHRQSAPLQPQPQAVSNNLIFNK